MTKKGTKTMSTTTNIQYTDEWFKKNDDDFESEDFKAIKERLEHLPKMMDELNELLKNGERRKAESLALSMRYYVHGIWSAIKSDYEYISWGHADRIVTY